MSRKALHHHYASASKTDADHTVTPHSSNGSNGTAESSDEEIDIKWSDRGYTVEEIVEQFSLPKVVRFQTEGRAPRTSLPIPFSLAQEHILLFSASETRHLVASNINEPSKNNLKQDVLHNEVTIPEEFDGLFVRPHTTNNGSELKAHQHMDSLVKTGTKGFLTLTTIQGLLSRSSQSNNSSNYVKTSYPSRSLFLIEEIQNWSEKIKTGNNVHKIMPFMRQRSSPANIRSASSHHSRKSSNLEDDRSSHVIASAAGTTTSSATNVAVPARKHVNVKENENVVLMKMAEEDDVFLLDAYPRRGAPPRPQRSRSASAESNYVSMSGSFAKCKDSTGRIVYFPLSATGLFIQINNHPTNKKKLSLTVPELLNSDTLPPIVTFVYGKKMRLLMASGFLKPKRVEEHRSVLACSLGKTSFVFFEIPMASPMKFCLSLNKSLLNTPRLRSACRLCANKGNDFATDMKVIINLSSKHRRKDGKGSSSETSSKLEDIAEEDSAETDETDCNNSDKDIDQLSKNDAELLEGTIYI